MTMPGPVEAEMRARNAAVRQRLYPPTVTNRAVELRQEIEQQIKQEMEKIATLNNARVKLSELQKSRAELTGKVAKLRSQTEMQEEEIRRLIAEMTAALQPGSITVGAVIDAASEYFKIPTGDILSKRRRKDLVRARQVVMWVSTHVTRSSLPQIGNRLGGMDHTTVLHGIRKIDEIIETGSEPAISNAALALRAMLEKPCGLV